jgi:hypothetical protein
VVSPTLAKPWKPVVTKCFLRACAVRLRLEGGI